MNFYYYPLITRDFTFENIFSTESISPPFVYAQRGFGANYFHTLKSFHNPEMILLYEKPPKYLIDGESSDSIKFILKVQDDAIDLEKLISISDGIKGYLNTIYLNSDNFELLFFSERDIKVICLKSEIALQTKNVKKYLPQFKVISESECVEYNNSAHAATKTSHRANLDEIILFDRSLNTFKGFCYGLSIGVLSSTFNKDFQIQRAFQDIVNRFAEFKNKLENEILKGNDVSFDDKNSAVQLLKDKLDNSIRKAELLFQKEFHARVYSDDQIDNYVLEQLKKRGFNHIDSLLFLKIKKMEDVLLGTDFSYEMKSKYIKSNKHNPVLSFELLRDDVHTYIKSVLGKSENERVRKVKSADHFKQTIHELSNAALSEKNDVNESLDLSNLSYDKASGTISIEGPFLGLGSKDLVEYVTVLNIVMQNAKNSSVDKTDRTCVLNIVELVGTQLGKNISGRNTRLYQYLNGEINEYDSTRAHSVVMKNFVAFAFNFGSLEKMTNYLNAKMVDEKWIAYSFWCSFNGFGNISGRFLDPLFSTPKSLNAVYINYFIGECFKNGIAKLKPDQLYLKDDLDPVSENTSIEERLKSFFKKYVEGKHKLSSDEFFSIVQGVDREKVTDEFKRRHRISKRESVKILEQLDAYLNGSLLF